AFKDGFLLLASAPEAIRRFGERREIALNSAGEVPVFRMSLREIARYLKERREPLAAALSAKKEIAQEELLQRLDRLALSLQLFDQLEVSQSTGSGRMALVLRLRTAQALR